MTTGFGMRCFDENRNKFDDLHTRLEKWNLYNGLARMAEKLQSLASIVQQIQEEVRSLRQELGR